MLRTRLYNFIFCILYGGTLLCFASWSPAGELSSAQENPTPEVTAKNLGVCPGELIDQVRREATRPRGLLYLAPSAASQCKTYGVQPVGELTSIFPRSNAQSTKESGLIDYMGGYWKNSIGSENTFPAKSCRASNVDQIRLASTYYNLMTRSHHSELLAASQAIASGRFLDWGDQTNWCQKTLFSEVKKMCAAASSCKLNPADKKKDLNKMAEDYLSIRGRVQELSTEIKQMRDSEDPNAKRQLVADQLELEAIKYRIPWSFGSSFQKSLDGVSFKDPAAPGDRDKVSDAIMGQLKIDQAQSIKDFQKLNTATLCATGKNAPNSLCPEGNVDTILGFVNDPTGDVTWQMADTNPLAVKTSKDRKDFLQRQYARQIQLRSACELDLRKNQNEASEIARPAIELVESAPLMLIPLLGEAATGERLGGLVKTIQATIDAVGVKGTVDGALDAPANISNSCYGGTSKGLGPFSNSSSSSAPQCPTFPGSESTVSVKASMLNCGVAIAEAFLLLPGAASLAKGVRNARSNLRAAESSSALVDTPHRGGGPETSSSSEGTTLENHGTSSKGGSGNRKVAVVEHDPYADALANAEENYLATGEEVLDHNQSNDQSKALKGLDATDYFNPSQGFKGTAQEFVDQDVGVPGRYRKYFQGNGNAGNEKTWWTAVKIAAQDSLSPLKRLYAKDKSLTNLTRTVSWEKGGDDVMGFNGKRVALNQGNRNGQVVDLSKEVIIPDKSVPGGRRYAYFVKQGDKWVQSLTMEGTPIPKACMKCHESSDKITSGMPTKVPAFTSNYPENIQNLIQEKANIAPPPVWPHDAPHISYARRQGTAQSPSVSQETQQVLSTKVSTANNVLDVSYSSTNRSSRRLLRENSAVLDQIAEDPGWKPLKSEADSVSQMQGKPILGFAAESAKGGTREISLLKGQINNATVDPTNGLYRLEIVTVDKSYLVIEVSKEYLSQFRIYNP